MIHKATERFWGCFDALPQDIRTLAKKNFQLLKENPKHPSLQFKKLGAVWSVRVGLSYRALAIAHEGIFYWHWLGTHAEYDKLI